MPKTTGNATSKTVETGSATGAGPLEIMGDLMLGTAFLFYGLALALRASDALSQ